MADDTVDRVPMENSQPGGRRERHKRQTRRALQKAAVELFAERGFDDTTTEEVAAHAGVSPRTFFRYFPTKESVLPAREPRWDSSLTTHFLRQPDDLTDIEALRATLVSHAPRSPQSRDEIRLHERAVATSPLLRGRMSDQFQEEIERLATALAERRGLIEPDEACWVLAETSMTLYRRALNRWAKGPAGSRPEGHIGEQFDLLAAQVPGSVGAQSSAPSGIAPR